MLPELVRSLRSVGTARDAASSAAHDAVFPPLLDARARAANAPIDVILSALRGDALSARIEACVVDAAVGDIAHSAHARARTAEAGELLAPLRSALIHLDTLAADAREGEDGWNAWVAQLRRVFSAADVTCQALAAMLVRPDARTSGSKWFRPRTG